MAVGLPDWYKGVKADIIAQTLEKVAVDVVAATVGNLGIDIKAQTISNLDIDIAAQTIARLIQAPSYGGARYFVAGGTANPGDEISMFNISGTGIIYGGYIHLSGLQTPEHGYLGINIDGQGEHWVGIDDFDTQGIDSDEAFVFFNTLYDDINYIYQFKFMSGITFESSFNSKLRLSSSATGATTWYVRMIHALR